MIKTVLLLLVLAFAANVAFAADHFPSDVRVFMEKRDGCEHFSGEVPDPSDKKRMKEVMRQMDALCAGTDQALAKLKRKYYDKPGITARLNEYEPNIEANAERHERSYPLQK